MWWGGFELVSRHGLVVLAAFVVLARPTSVARLTAMLGALAVSVGADLPAVGSHRFLELVVAAAVLARVSVTTLRTRRLPSSAEVAAAVGPFLRLAVVVVYLVAALAKLNTSFLDPATSGAAPMVRPVLGADPALVGAAIAATVVVEAALPVLLVVRRTRLVGLVVGTGFHVVLALAGNVPFSAVVLALYVAFLPVDTAARLRTRPVGPAPWPRQAVVLAVLVGGWLVGAATGPSDAAPGLTAPPSALVEPALGLGAQVVTVVLAGTGVVLLVRSRRRAPEPPVYPPRTLRIRHPVLVLAAAVLVVDAAAPYLGVATGTSFEMFSGLRTEPGAWNHLVVPEQVRLFDRP